MENRRRFAFAISLLAALVPPLLAATGSLWGTTVNLDAGKVVTLDCPKGSCFPEGVKSIEVSCFVRGIKAGSTSKLTIDDPQIISEKAVNLDFDSPDPEIGKPWTFKEDPSLSGRTVLLPAKIVDPASKWVVVWSSTPDSAPVTLKCDWRKAK